MSTQQTPLQTQLKKDEADVLSSFQLANDHLHMGELNPNNGRAEKMQNVSVTVEEVLNVLECAGFYKETVALAVAKMRSGVSTGNYGPSFLYDARNERKKEAAKNRARLLKSLPKKSRFKPEPLDPAVSSLRK